MPLLLLLSVQIEFESCFVILQQPCCLDADMMELADMVIFIYVCRIYQTVDSLTKSTFQRLQAELTKLEELLCLLVVSTSTCSLGSTSETNSVHMPPQSLIRVSAGGGGGGAAAANAAAAAGSESQYFASL
jgi:hypothetical protein